MLLDCKEKERIIMAKIVIIDGNSLINRAYYAMQRPMITKDGIYTQGIYGFVNMLTKIIKEHGPTHMAVAFDLKAPTFRHEEYKEYKAGRKKMPPELAMQMPLLKEVLDAMNIKRVEKEGFEADDLIGTVAVCAEDAGIEPLIITGDKDELQLATDITKVLLTKKGVSQFELYDREKMHEVYGFSPEQFIDFKGMMGDSSDNIPGIPGVGEKTATSLILQFGTMENMLENIDEIEKPGLRKKVEENQMLAVMSKRLATINTKVPIEIEFEDYKMEAVNSEELARIYVKLEFNSFLKKMKLGESSLGEVSTLENATGGNEGAADSEAENIKIEKKHLQLEIIKDLAGLEKVKEDISKVKSVVVKVIGDNNRQDTPLIDGICISDFKTMYYITGDAISASIELINNAEVSLIGHNIKKDLYMLRQAGLDVKHIAFDTEVAQYLLDSGRKSYSMQTLATEYFLETLEEEKEVFGKKAQLELFADNSLDYGDYCKRYMEYLISIKDVLESKLIKENLHTLYMDVELPLIEPMLFMELKGFTVNRETLGDIGKHIGGQIEALTKEIYDFAGEEFNINSPSQLGKILFDVLGLPPSKKTKTGYSTNAEVLEKLMDEHEIVPKVIEYRTLAKLKGTYVDGLLPLINKDGKIHASFTQTVTATGRLSCTDPNLQNIPIRQELGRTIRKAFVPSSKDFILLGADYSQIELRVLADMSGDESLIEAFNNGEDIHKVTASRVLGVPYDDISVAERSKAKAVNFGVIYGMSAFGLSTEINVSRKEAERYISDYFAKHEKVKEFMDGEIEKCRTSGFVSTILGRKRFIKEITASNFMVRQLGERLAMNSPIQGSAADIIKLAMIKVHDTLIKGGFKSSLILQVHDELLIETHKDELEQVRELLRSNMENAMALKVKLSVDVNEGNNWYELK